MVVLGPRPPVATDEENPMPDPPKLGFFIQPVHPPKRRYADVLREDREAVALADRLGFREADRKSTRLNSSH